MEIAKICNSVLLDKFEYFLRKEVGKQLKRTDSPLVYHDFLRLLFHGTCATDPSLIYDSEEGFDFRFAKETGMFGTGIYFALDPAYSHLYAYKVKGTQNVYQMLISLVNTGRSKSYSASTSET